MMDTKWSAASIAELRADPVAFAIDVLRFDGIYNSKLTKDQLNLLEDMRDELPRRVAVRGDQCTGKTTFSVMVALWRAFQGKQATVVVTAPTIHQLKDVWMVELSKVLYDSTQEFQDMVDIPTRTSVRGYGNVDFGRIMMKASSKPENFMGYCSPHMTFIVDEASCVGRDIFRSLRGELSNGPNTLLLALGNPAIRDCTFFDLFNSVAQAYPWVLRTWKNRVM